MSKKREKFYKKSPYRVELKKIIKDIVTWNITTYDVKKLYGFPNYFRLRRGKVRIVFEKQWNTAIIRKIDTRGQIYKNL